MSDKTKCGQCGSTDFTPGGACRACKKKANEKYRAKTAGGGRSVKAKVLVPVSAVTPTLEIEQGYGLKARIDEAYLIVEQHDGETDSDDSVCLSRSEFRLLIEKFGSWAAA